jgi:hypothetical protein
VRLVVVGRVDIRDAAIEGFVDQPPEAIHSEIALHLTVVAAGPEAESRDGHGASAECDLIAGQPPHSRLSRHAERQRGTDRRYGRPQELPPIDRRHSRLRGGSSSRRGRLQVKFNCPDGV